MKRITLSLLLLGVISLGGYAQQSVSIGTDQINNNAVLWLQGNGSQGLILPIVTNKSAASATKGMVVFDDSDKKVYYNSGTAWIEVGGGGTGVAQTLSITGNTLSISSGNSVQISGTNPTVAGQLLQWNGTQWVSTNATAPATGQVLKWNGTAWAPGVDNTGGASIILGNGQLLTGNGTANTATTITGDVTLSGSALTISPNAVNSSKIADGSILGNDINAMSATNGQVLKFNGTTWVPAPDDAGGTVTNVSGTGPISVATPTTTPVISISQANGTTNGFLSSVDWATFSAKLGAASTTGGDLSGTVISPTVVGIQGRAVANTVPTNGQILKFNGTSWVPAPDDVGGGATPTLSNGQILIGDGSSNSGVALSGDATLSAGSLTIANNAINSAKIADGSIVNADVNAAAAIAGSKINPDFGAQNVITSGSTSTSQLIVNNEIRLGASPGTSGQILTSSGPGAVPTWITPGVSGTVTNVSGTGPILVNTPTTTPVISILQANGTTNGFLSSVDWATFSAKLGATSTTSGDLSGTVVSPTVVGIQGRAVANTVPTNGQILKFNGTSWAPAPDDVGGGATPTLSNGQILIGDGSSNSGVALSGDATLSGGALTIANNAINSAKITDGSVGAADLSAMGATVNQVLQFNGSAWAPTTLPAGGTVTSVSGTGPISVATPTTTPVISISQANGTTNGFLSSVDWATFSAKLGAASTTGGDLSGTVISPTVVGIQGRAVANTVPTNGQILKFNGTSWVPAPDDIGGTTPTLSNGQILIGDGSSNSGVALSGDATLSGGALTIANNAINSAKITDGSVGAADLSAMGATVNQVLQFNGSAWAPTTLPAGGTVTSVSGTGPISVATPTTTPVISISQANGTTNGFISSADWSTFNTKLGTGSIAGGDLGGTFPNPTVNRIRGTNVVATAPVANQVLQFNGTDWAPTTLPVATTDQTAQTGVLIGDGINITGTTAGAGVRGILGSNNNTIGWVTGTANQLLGTNGVGDLQFTDKSNFVPSALNAGQLFVGNGSNIATGVAMSGDGTMSSAGAFAIAPGVIVDADVNAAAAIAGTKINPNFGAQNITTSGTINTGGLSTTSTNIFGALAGGGNRVLITANDGTLDAVNNAVGVLTNDGVGGLTWATSSGWGLTGNAGTNPATNFIGTTDANNLSFRQNNIERMVLSATGLQLSTGGSFGIGGFTALRVDGANDNVFVGPGSGALTTGASNVFMGANTGAANVGGIRNTFIGTNTGFANTSGARNTFLGSNTGTNNTTGIENVFIGDLTGQSNVTGSNNTLIGRLADVASGGLNNATAIGAGAIVNASNRLVLGAPNTAVQFNGELRPNDLPGTAGQVLTSQGPGATPTWTNVGGSGWGLTGNAGTLPASNFIGTTDAQGLSFRTNNTERMLLASNNNAGSNLFTIPAGAGTEFYFPSGGDNIDFLADGQLNLESTTNVVNISGLGVLLQAGGGNVGIGVGSSNAPLQFASSLAKRKIVLAEAANNDHEYFGFGVTSAELRYHTDKNSSHVFSSGVNSTTSTELMRIRSDGHVGIGTSNPLARFHIEGNGDTEWWKAAMYISQTGASPRMYSFSVRNNGNFQIGDETDNSDRLVISPTGDIGIGTFTPQAKLDIVGSIKIADGTQGLGKVLTSDANGLASWQPAAGGGWGLTGNAGINPAANFIGTTDAQPLRFSTGVGGVERMRIDATGSVGIGTITPTASLDILGDNGVIARGNFGAGTIPATGAGVRMMFYPRKAAFRVGRTFNDGGTESQNWDDANIGDNTFAAGQNTIASGVNSFAVGKRAYATADASVAMGDGTQASNLFSVAMGIGAVAAGRESFSMGRYTVASSQGGIALGHFNVTGGNPDAFVSTDPLFELGNGTGFLARSNAFTVLKNGKTSINGANPTVSLEINGTDAIRLPVGTDAQRPGAPVAGFFRYNSTGGILEYHNGGGWQSVATGAGSPLINNNGTRNLFAGSPIGTTTTGADNAFYGSGAGSANSGGSWNVFMGSGAGAANTTGFLSTFIGWRAGASATNNAGNTFIGAQAGESTTENVNTFIGEKAGQFNTVGSENVFMGNSAGITNINGGRNTIIGNNANVGAAALQNSTAIGYRAFVTQINSLVLGSINGVNGANANTNVGIGTTAPAERLDVNGNLRLSGSILPISSGRTNLFIAATNSTTTGLNNFGWLGGSAISSGNYNVILGNNAGIVLSTGGSNIFMGTNAGGAVVSGNDNVFIGSNAGSTATTSGNVAIGFNATIAAGITNAVALGNSANSDANNKIVIGNASNTTVGGYGSWTNYSDRRLKENINYTSDLGLNFILKLKPATYNYISDNNKRNRNGLIAQDVEKIIQELGIPFSGLIEDDNKDKTLNLAYSEFVMPLITAIQEQQKILDEQKIEIQKLKSEKGTLEAKVTSIEAQQQALAKSLEEIKRMLGAEAKK